MSTLDRDLELMYAMQRRAEEQHLKRQGKSCGLRSQDELHECIEQWRPHLRDTPNAFRICQEAHVNRLALCFIELENEVHQLKKS